LCLCASINLFLQTQMNADKSSCMIECTASISGLDLLATCMTFHEARLNKVQAGRQLWQR